MSRPGALRAVPRPVLREIPALAPTPIVRIVERGASTQGSAIRIHDRRRAGLFASLEGENPGGSIKDHLVRGQLEKWAQEGELRPGRILAEASAGSTARSLAWHARQQGCRCVIFAPDSLPAGHAASLRADLDRLVAVLITTPVAEIYSRLYEFCDREDALCLDQLRDAGKRRHYAALGTRISQELGPIDALIGAVGTGHSLLGIAEGMNPRPRVVSAEPLNLAVPGVRNVEQVRFGTDDPVRAADFDERMLVSIEPTAGKTASGFRCDRGEAQASESFEIVLQGASQWLDRNPGQRLFLIGAANYRRDSKSSG